METSHKKVMKGSVVSNKMEQTIVVQISISIMNKMYRKSFPKTKKYKVHDAEGKAKVGDVVMIEECRPISKTKTWRLLSVNT